MSLDHPRLNSATSPPTAGREADCERTVGEHSRSGVTDGGNLAERDRLRDLVREWLSYYFGEVVWRTLARVVVTPSGLTTDWWRGRRNDVASPVRALVSVVLLGSLLSGFHRLAYPGAGADVGFLLEVFIWQSAFVISATVIVLMPKLLPSRLHRSRYDHAVFALHEATFFTLVAWAGVLVLLSVEWWPMWSIALGTAFTPLIAPGILALLVGHATWHLRNAYGLSWAGAVLRIGVLGATAGLAGAAVTAVLSMSGIADLWTPTVDGPMGVFSRE